MSISIQALPASASITHASDWLDTEGGAALRCCLRNSRTGERVRTAAVTPPGPQGVHAETGPVFMHADGCDGPQRPGYPDDFRSRPLVFRAYDTSGQIVGGEIVEPGTDHEAVAERLLAKPDVAFLHVRDAIYGCLCSRNMCVGGGL